MRPRPIRRAIFRRSRRRNSSVDSCRFPTPNSQLPRIVGQLSVGRWALELALALLVRQSPPACGKKGPPLAPIVHVPAAVEQIEARRRGNDVYVTVTVPAKNIDGSMPVDVGRVEVYGYTGTDAATASRFLEVATLVGDDRRRRAEARRSAGRCDAAKPGEPVPGGTGDHRRVARRLTRSSPSRSRRLPTDEARRRGRSAPAPATASRDPDRCGASTWRCRSALAAVPVRPARSPSCRLTPLPDAPLAREGDRISPTPCRARMGTVGRSHRLPARPRAAAGAVAARRSAGPQPRPRPRRRARRQARPATTCTARSRRSARRCRPRVPHAATYSGPPLAAVNARPLDALTFSDPLIASRRPRALLRRPRRCAATARSSSKATRRSRRASCRSTTFRRARRPDSPPTSGEGAISADLGTERRAGSRRLPGLARRGGRCHTASADATRSSPRRASPTAPSSRAFGTSTPCRRSTRDCPSRT